MEKGFKFSLILVLMFSLCFFGKTLDVQARATGTKNFVVKAKIPSATSVTFSGNKIKDVDDKPVVVQKDVSSFDFGTLKYVDKYGTWMSDYYFNLYVGASGGAGNPSITVQYTEGAKPTGQKYGLGHRTTVTFVKVTRVNDKDVENLMASHPKKFLASLSKSESIASSELVGGWFKMYVGTYDGNDPNLNQVEGGAPFTNGDQPGTYDGTLKITATVQ